MNNDIIITKTIKEAPGDFKPNAESKSLFERLEKEGYQLGLALTNSAFNLEQNSVTYYGFRMKDGVPLITDKPITTEFNRTNGLLNKSGFIYGFQQINPETSILNSEELRIFADKSIQVMAFRDLFYPTHVFRYPVGALIEEIKLDNQTLEFINTHTGRLVLKPTKGFEGKNVKIVESAPKAVLAEVDEIVKNRRSKGKEDCPILIQPFMKLDSIPGLQVIPSQQKLFEKHGNTCELRIFCSLNRSRINDIGAMTAIGRIVDPWHEEGKVDEWLSLVQETVPTEAYLQTAKIVESLMIASGSKASTIVVDYRYTDGKFYVGEINLRDPYYPTQSEDSRTFEAIQNNIVRAFEA